MASFLKSRGKNQEARRGECRGRRRESDGEHGTYRGRRRRERQCEGRAGTRCRDWNQNVRNFEISPKSIASIKDPTTSPLIYSGPVVAVRGPLIVKKPI